MSGQLVKEAMQGRDVERVPVAPLITLPHASRLSGVRPYEYFFDSRIYAAAQLHAQEVYGYDWVFAHQIVMGLSEKERSTISDQGEYFLLELELGCTFKVPKEGAPFIIDQPVKSGKDIDIVTLPDLSTRERQLPITMMKEKADFVCGNIRCPFTMASTLLMDGEAFYIALKRDPELVDGLMEIALEYCLGSARSQIEAGVDAMFIEDPSASPNVISPLTFRELVLPFEKRLVKEIKKDVPVAFHICGDVTDILDDMIGTGADCISVDETMDIHKVHEKTSVWGNIPSKTLVKGTPEEVYKEAAELVKIGSGLVLSSGCVIPPTAKEENIKALVRASHEA